MKKNTRDYGKFHKRFAVGDAVRAPSEPLEMIEKYKDYIEPELDRYRDKLIVREPDKNYYDFPDDPETSAPNPWSAKEHRS